MLVEGAGGLLVHLDAGGGTLADLARELGAPTIVVARAGLGTLNASALTCEALATRGVECLGLVIGAWPRRRISPPAATSTTSRRTPAGACSGDCPMASGTLEPDEFLEVAKAGTRRRTPEHGGVTDIAETLEALRRDGLYRRLRTVDSAQGHGSRSMAARSSCCAQTTTSASPAIPAVRAAAAQAAERWGAGAGASRLVSGNMTIHSELEHELAEFKGHEACVLFGSGYLANTGVIAALAGSDDVILSDALNHASIIEGCRQSRAETIVYRHRDLDALAAGLSRAAGRRALIVTDAVFSMDGDLAPLAEIVELAERTRRTRRC